MEKKTFKEDLNLTNPAMNIISTDRPPQEGPSILPTPWETKAQRLQLLVKPSLVRLLKERAKSEHDSVNNLANRIFEEALTGNKVTRS